MNLCATSIARSVEVAPIDLENVQLSQIPIWFSIFMHDLKIEEDDVLEKG